MKHILITGLPGTGKSTIVKKVINLLKESKVDLDGFTTEEIRNERFQRAGFNACLIKSGASSILADKSNHPPNPNLRKLGQYTVYVKRFEDLVLPPLVNFDKGILVLDEIGKMELFSKKFEETVLRVFRKQNVLILATVPTRGPPFVEQLKRDEGCELITVTTTNRDSLPNEIVKMLLINER